MPSKAASPNRCSTSPPVELLTPSETDLLLRLPRGRSVKLARQGQLPHYRLPDDEYRFPADLLDRLNDNAPSPGASKARDGVLMRIVPADDGSSPGGHDAA
ncbi:MAG: hypothetical protein AAF561_00625 [Planctomycetota bacterium]